MTTYKKLRQEPVSRALFNNRITTLQALYDILDDSAFIAIDTEHTAVTSERDRVLDQIGLSHIETLRKQDVPEHSAPSLTTSHQYLREFYARNQMQALTLNIVRGKEEQDRLFRLRGGNMPARRAHRFGQEQHVKLEDLEGAVIDFIQRCNTKTNLVLIGFEMAAEWTYLFTNFPGAIPLFSAWVDLRDIAHDIAPVGLIPGLVTSLQIFGYHWKDLRHSGENYNGGISDNAGLDAVATCALAHALLHPDNHEKLRFRQECGKIARIFTRKKGLRAPPDPWNRFTATICARGPLPSTINSEMKLARRFFDHSPQYSGIISDDMAYLNFRSQDQLNHFVSAADGLILETGEALSVQVYSQDSGAIERERTEREEKQKLRKMKRLEETRSGVEDLTGLFY